MDGINALPADILRMIIATLRAPFCVLLRVVSPVCKQWRKAVLQVIAEEKVPGKEKFVNFNRQIKASVLRAGIAVSPGAPLAALKLPASFPKLAIALNSRVCNCGYFFAVHDLESIFLALNAPLQGSTSCTCATDLLRRSSKSLRNLSVSIEGHAADFDLIAKGQFLLLHPFLTSPGARRAGVPQSREHRPARVRVLLRLAEGGRWQVPGRLRSSAP
jgi:hypothetical protein